MKEKLFQLAYLRSGHHDMPFPESNNAKRKNVYLGQCDKLCINRLYVLSYIKTVHTNMNFLPNNQVINGHFINCLPGKTKVGCRMAHNLVGH